MQDQSPSGEATDGEMRHFEVTTRTSEGVEVCTIDAPSESEAHEKARDRDQVTAVRDDLTVEFERDADGNRVY